MLVHEGHILIVVPDIALALLAGEIRKRLHVPDPYGIDSGTDSGPIAFNSPGHLSFFSRNTLRLLLTRIGWEIIKHKHAPYVLSGSRPLTCKDLVKPVLFYLVSAFDRIGIGPMNLSYSQLSLAKK